MVIIFSDYYLQHKLTEEGEEAYRQMLEKEADKILYKNEHPILYFFNKIIEFFKN